MSNSEPTAIRIAGVSKPTAGRCRTVSLACCAEVVTDRAAGRLTPVRQAQPSAVIDAARAFSARVYRPRAHAAHPSVGLTIDPDNELATNSVKLIEDIYASMGRPVPQPA